MVSPDIEQRFSPENGNLMLVDPSELMRDNPAALIVNTESYARMEAHFSPEQLDPPQVVKVRSYSAQHGEVIKLFVVDGLTRTKFAADHKGASLAGYPDFQFDTIYVRDVTASTRMNPIIVPPEEREGEEALSMIQYLRAVVPPTAEHSQIAADRIAAHLINGWENMVGDDLAQKFSALAAMQYIARGAINEALLREKLKRQKELLVGEGVEERALLERQLLQMASIIREAKLVQSEVVRSAFMLVSVGSSVIGGEKVAMRQVHGMLHTPEVEKKLTEAFLSPGDREAMRLELGTALFEAVKSAREQVADRQQNIDSFGKALNDPELSFDQAKSVFLAERPAEKYQLIAQGANAEKLRRVYEASQKNEGLSLAEITLLGNLGRVTYLDANDIPAFIRSVRRADETDSQGYTFMQWLRSNKEHLQNNGITEQTINSTLIYLDRLQVEMLDSNSPTTLNRKIQVFREAIASANSDIARKINEYQVGQMVAGVYGSEAEEGFGPIIGRNIVSYILREVAPNDQVAVDKRLKELYALDDDLQTRVVSGDMRINYAIKLQRERGNNTRVHTGDDTIVNQQPILTVNDTVIMDKKGSEERRRQVGNEQLIRAIDSMLKTRNELDIETQDLTNEAQQRLKTALRVLGKLYFGHPDIVRAHEEYEQLLHGQVRDAKARVEKVQEEAARDTRTKQ